MPRRSALVDTTSPTDIEAELLAATEREERAAAEATVQDALKQPGPEKWTPEATPMFPGALPLADLRERLTMLAAAWVELYEDGPLRIKFDLEARRAHVQATEGTSGKQEW